jgi:hypothetical protein
MATSNDTAALKIQYKSPLDINERQVSKAIELMQSQHMPHNKDAEMTVLGAILITNDTSAANRKNNEDIARIVKVRNMLKPKDFYLEEHQYIFEAICNLVDTKKGVDIVTVTAELMRMGKVDVIGGPFYIVELTNRVGSSVHAIEHAQIIVEMSLRRSAILANYLANTRLFDLSSDVFNVRNELADDLRVMPITSFLRARTASERLEDGRNLPKVQNMCGSLWKKGELVFLFAGPKRGKSIFAVQIADALSKGEGLFNGVLSNETEPQRVGYVDFELMDNEFFDRYSDERSQAGYGFSENLVFIDINPDFNDYNTGLDKVIFQSIEDAVLSCKLDALVIDNITWMAQVATSDTQAALELMRKLDQLKKRTGISILILAHSPKINAILPLDENMMGGSKHLSNFAQGVFAIGKSAIDSSVRYIKECVRRNGMMHFDDENVIQVSIDKTNGFLQYTFMQMSSESIHLNDPNDADTKLLLVKEGAHQRKTTPKSFQQIFDDMNIKEALGWTPRQWARRVKDELAREGASLIFMEDSTDEDAPFKPNGQMTPAKSGTDIPF